MPLSAGDKLGPYEIESKIGAGGMGEVYRATDSRLGRAVALKVLPGHLSQNSEFRQRMQREAKAISSLSHPHICALYDVGQEGDTDFLVMEFLEGETLSARLEKGALPLEQVLRYGMEIADALDKAHRQGIVHRDLKPGNIILTKSGAKLLDFGLASVKPPATGPMAVSATGYVTAEGPLTAEGSILGTFQYMAPEQLEGEEADSRTDIFALGLVLYEMATGQKAFQGKSQASLIASILQGEPAPISGLQPMTPPALERVIRGCLAKDPEDRWQTARDIALQLRGVAEGGSEIGVPAPVAARRKSRERIAWALAAVGAVAAVVLGAAWITRPQPAPPKPIRFQATPPGEVGSVDSPRISPDGRYIAYNATDTTGVTRIWLRPLGDLRAQPLSGTEGAGRPIWSPDSRSVAFFAGGKLKRVDIIGSPPRSLGDIPGGADGSWGREGVILFDGGTGDSIRRVAAGGGLPGPATVIRRQEGEAYHAWPEFLPDGKHFLFLAYGPEIDGARIKIGSLDSEETTTIGEASSRVAYAEPGYLLFVRDGTLLATPFDPGRRVVSGEPFPVVEEVGGIGTGLAHFGVSSDGVLIYQKGDFGLNQLLWVDREGRRQGVIGSPAAYDDFEISPDGRRIVVEIEDPESGSSDLWMIEPARGVTTRFTFDPANDSYPTWSPDGRSVAFSSSRNGSADIFLKDASGSADADSFLVSPATLLSEDWSRDGRILVYQSIGQGTSRDIWTVDLTDKAQRPLIRGEFPEVQAKLSPNGRWISYASNESGRWEVYVQAVPGPGGKWQVSNRGGTEPRWRDDGKELYYLSLDRQLMAIEVATEGNFEVGVPTTLFTAPVSSNIFTHNRYDCAGDGQRFLLVNPLESGSVPATTVVVNWLDAVRPESGR